MVPRRGLRDDQRSAAVSLACCGSRRRCDRDPGAVPTQPACRGALLSQALEGSRKDSAANRHRQIEELRCCAPDDHAFGKPSHRTLREQSGGSFTPTNPAARTTNATVQVSTTSSTLPFGAWPRSESLPIGQTQTKSGSPPDVESAIFCDLGSDHGRLIDHANRYRFGRGMITVKLSKICPFWRRNLVEPRPGINNLESEEPREKATKRLKLTIPDEGFLNYCTSQTISFCPLFSPGT